LLVAEPAIRSPAGEGKRGKEKGREGKRMEGRRGRQIKIGMQET
jgi:hypothetical protein